LEDAEALLQQAEMGGSGSTATNSLAVLLLKAQAFATSAGLPSDLELQLGQIEGFHSGEAAQVADLDALCAILGERIMDVEGEVRALSQDLLSSASYDFLAPGADSQLSAAPGLPGDAGSQVLAGTAGALEQVIARLENEVRQLQAELEQEAARKRGLQRARDLAWETFSALSSKKAEVGVEAAVTGSEVRFASPAIAPAEPSSPKKALNTAVAAVVGLMVGGVSSLALELWKQPPLVSEERKRAAQ
jgi:hypothetical protein